MRTFAIKGMTLGEGRPHTIVSLMGATGDELLQQARRAVAAGAECLEWRVDFFRTADDVDAVRRASVALAQALPDTPLVGTFRSVGQGGSRELSCDAYVALARTLVEGGVDIVDVELDRGEDVVRELVDAAHERDVRVIVSHHDFERTPATQHMVGLFARMTELDADLPKLAVMARCTADCLHLMEAAERTRATLHTPLIAIAMGAHGTLSRLAGEVCGSALTFCSLEQASAPGQVGLAQATALLDSLHDLLARAEQPTW